MRTSLKGAILFIFSICVQTQFVSGQTKLRITIQNSSNEIFREQVISIPWKHIITKSPLIDSTNFVVIDVVTKKEIPFQLEYAGKSAIQNLLIQADVKPKAVLKINIQKGQPTNVVSKTFCRYVPERKDDFAWENDKIAFRMYGKALEGTNEDAYGIDVWVKRTTKLVLNERYKRGEYHIDHGDGMDYYHVGHSLGAGNMAPYVNDSIWYSKNYEQWSVLDNGPLRSSFKLSYSEWDVAGRAVKVTKTISLDAGSQLNRIEVNYSINGSDSLPVVAGIVKRKQKGLMMLDEQKGIMAYWEPAYGDQGITGTGCIFFDPVVKMKVSNEQLLTQLLLPNNIPIFYYTGAAWSKATIIKNAEEWFSYLRHFKAKIINPLKIIVE